MSAHRPAGPALLPAAAAWPIRRQVLALPLAALAPAVAQGQGANTDFPSRPVAMVVAFPPGGQADVVARPIAAGLERHWRQAVPIANRAGAAGELGNAFVARAAPDGYTVLMALSSIIVLPDGARISGRTPAYELDQLTPIALFTADPTLLVVRAESPWRTLAEFIADAKRRPGAITFSSAGIYSSLHVSMGMLATAAGLDLLHIPFQGGGPAMTALISGQVDALSTGPGPAAAFIREGRLRALASWGAERFPEFPEVPTLIESGFPEAEYYIWVGAFAPAGTPAPIREALRAAMAATAADPEVRRALIASGNRPDYREGEAFERFFRADAARISRLVQRMGRLE
jgi:tripartite-type tricarboxylate transporter receptor subunit TctC